MVSFLFLFIETRRDEVFDTNLAEHVYQKDKSRVFLLFHLDEIYFHHDLTLELL